MVSGACTSEPAFADGWTGEVLSGFWARLAEGGLSGALGVRRGFVTGPHRTAADLDPAIPALVDDMTLKTLRKHAPGEPGWSTHAADTWARAARLTIPVLAVVGAADAAHHPNMQHPAEFDAIVGEFMNSLI